MNETLKATTSMQTPPNPRVWVLLDDRAGNSGQSLGVAEALGYPEITKRIAYNFLVGLPNILRGPSSLVGVDEASRGTLKAPWPDIVIASGRRLAPVSLWVKEKTRGKAFAVHIMDPLCFHAHFDLIAVPNHDKLSGLPNLLKTVTAPNRISAIRTEENAARWQPLLEKLHLPKPWVMLAVGGSSKHGVFSVAQATELAKRLSRIVQAMGGSILLTTSRRTGQAQAEALRDNITVPSYIYFWGQGLQPAARYETNASFRALLTSAHNDLKIVGAGAGAVAYEEKVALRRLAYENPYEGFLGVADGIVITGDSVSMLSDAVRTGKPAYVYPGAQGLKHQALMNELVQLGAARILGDTMEYWQYTPLDAAATIAATIKARLKLLV